MSGLLWSKSEPRAPYRFPQPSGVTMESNTIFAAFWPWPHSSWRYQPFFWGLRCREEGPGPRLLRHLAIHQRHRALANNGEWIAFVSRAPEGDGVMTLRSIGGRTLRWVISTGPQAPASPPTPDSSSSPSIPCTRWWTPWRKPMPTGTRCPQDSLGIIDLSSGVQRGLHQRRLLQGRPGPELEDPRRRGRLYLAYLLEADEEEPDSTAEGEEGCGGSPGQGRGEAGGGGAAGGGRRTRRAARRIGTRPKVTSWSSGIWTAARKPGSRT